jgi:hypothetical protein
MEMFSPVFTEWRRDTVDPKEVHSKPEGRLEYLTEPRTLKLLPIDALLTNEFLILTLISELVDKLAPVANALRKLVVEAKKPTLPKDTLLAVHMNGRRLALLLKERKSRTLELDGPAWDLQSIDRAPPTYDTLLSDVALAAK